MISVILVEDHPSLREDICFGLNAEGLMASAVPDAAALDARIAARGLPSVLVLDWNLPGESGVQIARRITTEHYKKVGLVMLTARTHLDDRVEGLSHVDAYLTKPVHIRELAAVIRSIHRRMNFVPPGKEAAHWRLLPPTLELVSPYGEAIPITHNECTVLKLLARSAGKPVKAREIVEGLDENWLDYEKNRLELLLSRLRQKIKPLCLDIQANPFKAIRGEGYQLTLPIQIMPGN